MTGIRKNAAAGRYEMEIDGEVAFVTYAERDGIIHLLHAEVPRALRGRGAGSRLAAGVLDAIRAEGGKMVPRCGFIADFVHLNPAYRDLVA